MFCRREIVGVLKLCNMNFCIINFICMLKSIRFEEEGWRLYCWNNIFGFCYCDSIGFLV